MALSRQRSIGDVAVLFQNLGSLVISIDCAETVFNIYGPRWLLQYM